MNQKPQFMYVLPNIFTAASAFIGIIAVIAASKAKYDLAIVYIFLSLILDGLDGRVARLTGTSSKFGVEFDSLADIIAFGVAPAMLFYFCIGNNFGRIGTTIAALFVVFGAIRLARFNVTTGTYDPSVFIGLPIPTAAVSLALWIGAYEKYKFLQDFGEVFLFLSFLLSILMVSNIRFPSFKKVNFKEQNSIKLLVCLIILFALLYLHPLEISTILFTSYILYGIIRAVKNFWFRKKKQE